MWLLTPNIYSEMLYPPQKQGYYPGTITTRPIIENDENRLVYFSRYDGGKSDSSYIAILSQNGKQEKRLNIDYRSSLKGALFSTVPKSRPNKIVLFSRDGKLLQFDTKLDKITEDKIFVYHSFIIEFDVDNDSIKEQIFRDLKHNIILARNNFLYPFFLPINITGCSSISIESTNQEKHYLDIQVADTLYKIDYHQSSFYPFRYFIYFLIWSAVFFGFHLVGKVYRKIASCRYESEKQLAHLQLTAIENQLNPHFNFNILNSIGALYESKETERVRYYIAKYSKLLRTLLVQSGKMALSIEEELEFTRNYLDLERLRMDKRFEYTISGEAEFFKIEIPKMLIHTFCENS